MNISKVVKYIWYSFILTLLGIVLILLIVRLNPFNLFGALPSLDVLENPKSAQASVVYAEDGVVLGKFFNEYNRSNCTYDEIPKSLEHALIATEDVRFYEHSGVDAKGVFLIIPSTLLGKKRGSSTLTQQLAKNLFRLRSSEEYTGLIDHTIVHKIKEWFIAIQLEENYSKQEILMMYLNTVDFGNRSFGIQAAAKKYFRKKPIELTTSECALLVGLLKGPSLYNPRKHFERAVARRNTVIEQMEKYEYLSKAESIDLKADSLILKYTDDGEASGLAPHLRAYIKRILKPWANEKGVNLEEDGLKIYTTIHSKLQLYAEEAMKKHMATLQQHFFAQWGKRLPWKNTEPKLLEEEVKKTSSYKEALELNHGDVALTLASMKEKHPQKIFTYKGVKDTMMSVLDSIQYSMMLLRSGLCSMDPSNGHIKAWVGNINYEYYPFDHVIQGKRQAGSTFKPIVYAYAMEEKGLTPESKITDAPISIPIEGTSNVWTPKNSNNKYSNEELTLKQGLAQSVNTISAQLMKMVGPDSVVAFAKRLGIKSPLDPTYSLCLGTGDVSLIEMVNAYAVFIDEGVWHQPIIITRIEDKYGNVLEEFSESSNIVMNEQTASYMIDLLKGSVEEEGGTSVDLVRKYAIKGEVGGKTGTTQNSSDGWFIGVAPNLVTGVWVGGERRVIRFPSMMYGQGAKMSLPTWAYYMQQVQAHPEIGYPASIFKQLTDTTSHSRSIDQLDGVDTVAVPSNRFSLDIYQ